ncbi:YciI family protein [Bacteroidota bacterium]
MKSSRNIFLVFLLLILISACGGKEKSQYFIFLNSNPDKVELPEAEVQSLQEKHLSNMENLAAAGDLIASGPFEGGGGMMVIIAENEQAARDLLETDPAIKAGRFIVEVFPISFIKGGICPWWVPVNIKTYGFFRFRPGPAHENTQLLQEHFYLLSVLEDDEDVLVQADFDDSASGILILSLPLSDEWIENVIDNPAIQEGALEVDIKNLQIAHGTFCD